MTRDRLAVVGLLLALASPDALRAQERDVCRLVTASNLKVTAAGTASERHEFRGPVHFTCAPDVTLRADSAVGRPATGRYLLIGDVFYEDSVKTLTAARLRYDRRLDRLFATGDVALHDLRNGSVLRGPELEHHGAAGRDRGEPRPAAGGLADERPAGALLPVVVDTAEGAAPSRLDADTTAAAETRRGTDAPAPTVTIVRGGAHATIRPRDSTDATREPAARAPETPGDPAPDVASPDSASPPLDVDADRIQITGERWFHAVGDVRMTRGESRSFANEATYDREAGRLTLEDAARIEDEAFELLGERIEATETEAGGTLRRVHATGDAVLLAEDIRLRAPGIRIFFEEGELHRLVAAGHDAENGGSPVDDPGAAERPPMPNVTDASARPARPDGPRDAVRADGEAAARRPRVDSPDLELTADSLDILAPGQRIERVTAVGDAYALRAPDTTVSADAVPPVPELARDWVRGDTITGHFTVDTAQAEPARLDADTSADPEPPAESAPTAPPDGAKETRAVLERIVAVGEDGRARSVYRIAADSTADGAPHYNYVIARRLVLSIRDGSVTSIEADGPLRGMDLQPVRRSAGDEPPAVDGPPAPPGRTR